MALKIILSFTGLFLAGVFIKYFVTTIKAYNKFDNLDVTIQLKIAKIARIKNFKNLIRIFSEEELIKCGKLTDEEILYYSTIEDRDMLIQKIREKING
ncbi:MAG: hypothetical protein LBQ46_12770 [Treponema sp.]|jgi:hypothetical protein|nr:hypothetical protein [Treponema sp.]